MARRPWRGHVVEQVHRRPSRHRLLAALLVMALFLAGCSDESSGEPDLESTDSAGATTTDPSAVDGDDTGQTSESPLPTLPLLPTTTTTLIDPSIDPPIPVADPPGPPGRNSVMVVGDSVLLGTASAIPLVTSHWLVTYDAEGNRRLAQAIDLFDERRDEIGEAVVIHLGNNFIPGERGDFETQVEAVMVQLWFVPRVVWVTVAEVSPSRVAMNETIREASERWPNMRVADWAPILAEHPEWTWDGMHLTPDGRQAMARLIADTLGPVDEP